ncbi:MAG: hypothetical protein K0R08_1073, partial [Solimicrobium sp.]|nr:hypothetical protein [Solimicrobium sp.]
MESVNSRNSYYSQPRFESAQAETLPPDSAVMAKIYESAKAPPELASLAVLNTILVNFAVLNKHATVFGTVFGHFSSLMNKMPANLQEASVVKIKSNEGRDNSPPSSDEISAFLEELKTYGTIEIQQAIATYAKCDPAALLTIGIKRYDKKMARQNHLSNEVFPKISNEIAWIIYGYLNNKSLGAMRQVSVSASHMLNSLWERNISVKQVGFFGASELHAFYKILDVPSLTMSINGFSGRDVFIGMIQSLSENDRIREVNFTLGSYLKLTLEEMAQLTKLTKLTSLNIQCNRLPNGSWVHLKNLTNLTSLNIGSNDLGPERVSHLENLTNLTFLNISFNNLGAGGVAHITKLTSLTYLGIGDNHLGYGDGAHLANLTNLTSLDLGGTELAFDDAVHLTKLTKL